MCDEAVGADMDVEIAGVVSVSSHRPRALSTYPSCPRMPAGWPRRLWMAWRVSGQRENLMSDHVVGQWAVTGPVGWRTARGKKGKGGAHVMASPGRFACRISDLCSVTPCVGGLNLAGQFDHPGAWMGAGIGRGQGEEGVLQDRKVSGIGKEDDGDECPMGT